MYNNKDLKSWNNRISLDEEFTLMSIDTEKLPQEYLDDWGIDTSDETTSIWYEDAWDLYSKDLIDWNDVEFDMFDEYAYREFIDNLVKPSNHYLLFGFNCTWRGSNGYNIVDNLEAAFRRSYECHQYPMEVTKGNKALHMIESHHDVPGGHSVVIIALTDKEYEKLDNSDFEDVEKFAFEYLKKLNEKSALRVLANKQN